MKQPKLINSKIINGVSYLKLDYFKDNRGLNYELDNSFTSEWKLNSISYSKKGVLRGFHGNKYDGCKMIQILHGRIQFVLFDDREYSKTKGICEEILLDGKVPIQIIFSPGILNAHLCLSEECVFFYKWENGYVQQNDQSHIKWNDQRVLKQITWLCNKPILSLRDK